MAGVAVVLSGGGSRGAFQVGALHFLYRRRNVRPAIVCGTSVGAINGIKLAEADPAKPDDGMAALTALTGYWLDLRVDADMWRWTPFLEANPQVRELATGLLGGGNGAIPDLPAAPPTAPLPVFQPLANMLFFAAVGEQLLPLVRTLVQFLRTEKSLTNLEPVRIKMADRSYLDPDKVSASGVQVRLATVSLETGGLRYVTETGSVLERDNATQVFGPPTDDIPPECVSLALALADAEATYNSISATAGDERVSTAERTQAAEELREADVARREAREALDSCLSAAGAPPPQSVVSLADGVLASASIPVIHPPVQLLGQTHVDAGIRDVLPIRAAVDLEADEIFAISASHLGSLEPPEPSFSNSSALEVGNRALGEIAIDEIALDDILLEAAQARTATREVHVIVPNVRVYDSLLVDPTEIRIFMDYGFMRAADVIEARSPELAATADRITSARSMLHAVGPGGDASLISRLQQQIQVEVATRRSQGLALPDDGSNQPLYEGGESALWHTRFDLPPQPVPPELAVSVMPFPTPLNARIELTVGATDARSGSPIAGEVRIANFGGGGGLVTVVFPTNTSRFIELRTRRGIDPATGEPTEVLVPTGTVNAPGFPTVEIDFGFDV